jgi:hypothetical protein
MAQFNIMFIAYGSSTVLPTNKLIGRIDLIACISTLTAQTKVSHTNKSESV